MITVNIDIEGDVRARVERARDAEATSIGTGRAERVLVEVVYNVLRGRKDLCVWMCACHAEHAGAGWSRQSEVELLDPVAREHGQGARHLDAEPRSIAPAWPDSPLGEEWSIMWCKTSRGEEEECHEGAECLAAPSCSKQLASTARDEEEDDCEAKTPGGAPYVCERDRCL